MSPLEIVVHRPPTPRQVAAVTGARPEPPDILIIDRVGDPYEVILTAVRQVEAAGLRPLRLRSDDWVTLEMIAERVGRSREAVRLWALGRSGPGGFPPPLNHSGPTSYFSWTEVAVWMHRHDRLAPDRPINHPEPVRPAANLALHLRRLAPRLTGLPALFELIASGRAKARAAN